MENVVVNENKTMAVLEYMKLPEEMKNQKKKILDELAERKKDYDLLASYLKYEIDLKNFLLGMEQIRLQRGVRVTICDVNGNNAILEHCVANNAILGVVKACCNSLILQNDEKIMQIAEKVGCAK